VKQLGRSKRLQLGGPKFAGKRKEWGRGDNRSTSPTNHIAVAQHRWHIKFRRRCISNPKDSEHTMLTLQLNYETRETPWKKARGRAGLLFRGALKAIWKHFS